MFCKNCGKEINDKAVICIHCGCSTNQQPAANSPSTSKTGIGVLLALFLGVIGLIIGLCLYPSNTYERQTFLKGWGIVAGIAAAIGVLYTIIIFFASCSTKLL